MEAVLLLILDFYVDEPACFGVPPYLSPYCRYTAGALADGGIPQEKIFYLTADQWRAQNKELPQDPELLFIIAGSTVPGKYLGGKIGTVAEIIEVLDYRRKYHKNGITLLGGPIRHASSKIKKDIHDRGALLVRGDIELYAYQMAQAKPGKERLDLFKKMLSKPGLLGARRNYTQVNRWASAGAFLSILHPNFPYLILELESYRGCTRDVFCSFCTEAFYGKPEFRSLNGIFEEVKELYGMGNRFFRLGRQADLLTYLADMQDFRNTFPRPNPQNIASLYQGIYQAAPQLKVLHLDNINPGLIATFPEESKKIIQIISEYNTPGDTAAMGVESADSNVVQLNDLKCNEAQAEKAVEIVNEYGAKRQNNLSKLLPGINLLHGLPGESEKTFEKNYFFLRRIMERGLLLRRINIRQTVVYSHTKLETLKKNKVHSENTARKKQKSRLIQKKFLYWTSRIRKEIDHPMLLANFPIGTCIPNVILEQQNQAFLFGRPLGSYPITIKIPLGDLRASQVWEEQKKGNCKKSLTVIVTGALERSLIALTHPIAVLCLDTKALESIPGIGRKRSGKIFLGKPDNFRSLQALTEGSLIGSESNYDFTRSR